MNRSLIAFSLALSALSAFVFQVADAQTVKLVSNDGKTQLLRNDKPYSIRGVGGDTHLKSLAAAGGNSIRTWNADSLEKTLDEAHSNGLSVCVGLWIGHERHGFDYQNQTAIQKQLDKCLASVRKYKDHPAVLIWAIGNEMEGAGDNPAVWYAVNHIAREIKAIDSDHPTMTVIAELGENENKIRNIGRFCPHIDVVGINSYGGIGSIAERFSKAGLDKPYIITEHGPNGPWEVGMTAWDSPLEATSTEKAKSYSNGYRKTVGDKKGSCLGTYAFLWGSKQETTATWFGMLLPDGTRLGAVDEMTQAWTGKPPGNRCPVIDSLKLSAGEKLEPGQKLTAKLTASDAEGDSLNVEWILRQDSARVSFGGDFQEAENAFKDAVTPNGMSAEVVVPKSGGAFRLFAYVRDGQGGAAVANVALFVDAPIVPAAAGKVKLPFTIYGDDVKPPYAPSGYMGNTEAINMVHDSSDMPKFGETCLMVEYTAKDNWGGVLWQSPSEDWDGTKPGGFDLTGADALEFYVRGASGGEKVSFMIGVIDGDKPYRDTAKAELKEVQLTKAWQKMRIPLNGLDLTRIKTGFGWSLAGQGKPVKFYLDDIQYVKE